ncbi:MAG: YitT family protein [Tissierellia bacterium]|nr:YitT family protein [Tissierellia bacterium]
MSRKIKAFNVKRFFLVNLGIFILVCGLYFFLIPNNLAVGGATGLAMLLNALVPKIPVSIFLFGINLLLFIAGFLTIGKDFGGYTIYASLAMSFMLNGFEKFIPIKGPLTDDLFINLIFGIFIQGFGMGIVLNQGASTGGTDIIAKMIDKYTRFTFGNGLIMGDGAITLGAAFIYGAELGMYALLGIIINAVVIDKMLAGFDMQYAITINSREWKAINTFILDDLFRGTTIYTAEGGFSGKERKMIQTVLDRDQYVLLREFVRNTDNHAFMYVNTVSEVEGEGFTWGE